MLKRLVYQFYEQRLLDEVLEGRVPRHLGLIQDGHRRYARQAGLSMVRGYQFGATKAEHVLTWCGQLKIPMVTLWWLCPRRVRSALARLITATFGVLLCQANRNLMYAYSQS